MNQQTRGISSGIASHGCKYLCHLRIAELEAGSIMTVNEINEFHKIHKLSGWVKNDCDVIRPNEIMEDFIRSLGGCSVIQQIGRISTRGSGSHVSFWAGKQPRPVKYCLVEYITENGTHWILCDHVMNELYDPWTEEYKRVKIHSINLLG